MQGDAQQASGIDRFDSADTSWAELGRQYDPAGEPAMAAQFPE